MSKRGCLRPAPRHLLRQAHDTLCVLLRRSAHRSVRELNRDIRAWIEMWNEDPNPYFWTKTADQILDSIARYCTRINASGH